MHIDPAQLQPADRYKLLIGGIVPRPIAFVSTISTDGRTNLAPFSFFAGIGSNPMSLLFCPANKADGEEKDTLRNARPIAEGGTGQFVVNIASERYERQVAAASEALAHGESEFELTGLTPEPSIVVCPPRVAESPLAYECETMNVIRLNPGAPGGPNIVIGRVVHIVAAEGVVNDRYHMDPARLAAIGRMGGTSYCRTRERFEMPFGKVALEERQ
jgi:flavin reductase (DIM6/NTAB) family NADH-FMN oxidoreductase RutF